jgi:hypothetical protein
MKRAWLAVVVLALAGGLSSCLRDETMSRDELSGTFQYVAYGPQGEIVVRGTLTFEQQGSAAVRGRWSLEATGADGPVGPQVGEGRLEGRIEDRSDGRFDVVVQLNPEIADNNVTLVGTFEDSRIQGRWSWTTLTGMANGGTFEARRQSGF